MAEDNSDPQDRSNNQNQNQNPSPYPHAPPTGNWNPHGAVGIWYAFTPSILHMPNAPGQTVRQAWEQHVQIGMERRQGYRLQMYFDPRQVHTLFPGVQRPQDLEVALVAVQDPVDFGVRQGGQSSWTLAGPEGIPCPCQANFMSIFYLFPRPEVTNIFLHFELLLQFRGDHPRRVRMDKRLRVRHDRNSGYDSPVYLPLDPRTLHPNQRPPP